MYKTINDKTRSAIQDFSLSNRSDNSYRKLRKIYFDGNITPEGLNAIRRYDESLRTAMDQEILIFMLKNEF